MKAEGEGDDRRQDGWIATNEFEQVLGDDEGQGSLACWSPWGRKESDMTEQLNNNSKAYSQQYYIVYLNFLLKL